MMYQYEKTIVLKNRKLRSKVNFCDHIQEIAGAVQDFNIIGEASAKNRKNVTINYMGRSTIGVTITAEKELREPYVLTAIRRLSCILVDDYDFGCYCDKNGRLFISA